MPVGGWNSATQQPFGAWSVAASLKELLPFYLLGPLIVIHAWMEIQSGIAVLPALLSGVDRVGAGCRPFVLYLTTLLSKVAFNFNRCE
jgi:hypothetical protein